MTGPSASSICTGNSRYAIARVCMAFSRYSLTSLGV